MTHLALVTGGSRGIGAAISTTLQQAGYTVAALYARDDVAASRFCTETGIPIFKFDVGNFDHCVEGVKMIENDMHGPIEILVNNAGITADATLHKMTTEQWHSVIQNNLTSCFNMSRCVIGNMRESNFGRIVNISSANAQAGQFGQCNYAASKAGIFGFTKALALENAKYHITVNAIAAGYVNTDMVKDIPAKVMDAVIARIPVGRLGDPQEIARCVSFLIDKGAGYITGSTLSINGGMRMD